MGDYAWSIASCFPKFATTCPRRSQNPIVRSAWRTGDLFVRSALFGRVAQPHRLRRRFRPKFPSKLMYLNVFPNPRLKLFDVKSIGDSLVKWMTSHQALRVFLMYGIASGALPTFNGCVMHWSRGEAPLR